ncbi:membrane protein insertase YidC [Desulfosarcina sp. OttesenSCG-928-G10]|nr:membrane protein insertase YidC [Desulfosarcina sp. OttesenSCG-928-G10]
MEQVRLFLAIGLSFLVLLAWSYFFSGRPRDAVIPPETPTAASDTQPAHSTDPPLTPTVPDMALGVETAPPVASAPAPRPTPEEKRIVVETPHYVATLSTLGATFHDFVLTRFKETAAPDSPQKNMLPESFRDGMLQASFSLNTIPGLENAAFSVDLETDKLVVKDRKQTLSFEWMSDSGVRVRKIFGFDPASYLVSYQVEIENLSGQPLHDALALSMHYPAMEDKGHSFTGPIALINNALEQVKIKKIKEGIAQPGKIEWIAYDDKYFIYSMIPETPADGIMKLSLRDATLVSQLVNPEFRIPPGGRETFTFYMFMGPKSMDVLKGAGHNLDKALNFGFFNIIAKPCLWFMNKIYSVVPNYGIAIIILTLFIKILLWPLGNKSYKSMNEMKKLQPLMVELREKYKDDKQKMNQEIMGLYRTYKINPMGGCLPMFLQFPVFIAFYQMLYQAIELRHAPFFLWINDLSAPDRLFQFGFTIPLMEPPYGIPVLTLMMGASMFLQQKMAPPPGDPAQARMMMFLPVIFTFIFINFSSGLVLYWFVNNVLSIGQQYYIQRKRN